MTKRLRNLTSAASLVFMAGCGTVSTYTSYPTADGLPPQMGTIPAPSLTTQSITAMTAEQNPLGLGCSATSLITPATNLSMLDKMVVPNPQDPSRGSITVVRDLEVNCPSTAAGPTELLLQKQAALGNTGLPLVRDPASNSLVADAGNQPSKVLYEPRVVQDNSRGTYCVIKAPQVATGQTGQAFNLFGMNVQPTPGHTYSAFPVTTRVFSGIQEAKVTLKPSVTCTSLKQVRGFGTPQ